MARLVGLLVLVVASAVAAAWLADHPGQAVLRWQGWEVRASVAVLAVAAIAAVILALALDRAVGWVRRGPGALAERRGLRRREQGYRALSDGLVAVAAGDTAAARQLGRRASSLLDGSPLPLLIEAQSAQASGDEAEARRLYERMLGDPETEFLALRGLTVQASNGGDVEAALGYARRAHALRPKAPWVLNAIAELEAKAGHWRAAETALADAARGTSLARVELDRRRAGLEVAQAREALAAGDTALALDRAREAHKRDPGLIPAAVLLAELQARAGKAGAAGRTIEAAWARAPHPDLARLYVEGVADGLARLRRIEKLAERNPDHVESRIAVAEAAIAAGLWGEARRWLGPLDGPAAPARACQLFAAIERGEKGDEAAARAWLARAASAPDAAWSCATCGAAPAAWAPSCPSCGRAGTQAWRVLARPVPAGLGVAGA